MSQAKTPARLLRMSAWLLPCLAVACIWLAPHRAAAADLLETQKLALDNSPGLEAQRRNFLAQRQTRYIAFGSMLPSVVARGSRENVNVDDVSSLGGERVGLGPTGGSTLYRRGWELELRQSLFSSGKNFNEYRRTRADILRSYHELRAAEQNILRAATMSHVDILRDQAVLELNRRNRDVLQRRYNETRDRFDLGLGNRTDVAQAESRLARAERDANAAGVALQISRAGYAELTGEWPERLRPPAQLPRLPESREEAFKIAQLENPSLQAAKEVVRVARFRTLSAIGEVLPQVNLIASYGNTRNPDFASVGRTRLTTRLAIQASVPLFSGGRNTAGISAARHAARAQTSGLETTLAATVREIDAAWSNQVAIPVQIRAARQQIVAAALALDGVRQEQELGARTVLDVLDAEQELLNARVALVTAERDQIVASYNLLAAIGRLTHDYLGLPPAETSVR
ncbi:MAG: TolC family outer membrane protein [Hyphomicrobiales bacterium]|nr:TolC family outer membrane protein [Hyphomicrobiales bacterium]